MYNGHSAGRARGPCCAKCTAASVGLEGRAQGLEGHYLHPGYGLLDSGQGVASQAVYRAQRNQAQLIDGTSS